MRAELKEEGPVRPISPYYAALSLPGRAGSVNFMVTKILEGIAEDSSRQGECTEHAVLRNAVELVGFLGVKSNTTIAPY